MFENFGKRFLEALQQAAEAQLGARHSCTLALALAIKTDTQADVEEAQKQMSALREDQSEQLLKAAHKSMREDPAALLDMWQSPISPDRSN